MSIEGSSLSTVQLHSDNAAEFNSVEFMPSHSVCQYSSVCGVQRQFVQAEKFSEKQREASLNQ